MIVYYTAPVATFHHATGLPNLRTFGMKLEFEGCCRKNFDRFDTQAINAIVDKIRAVEDEEPNIASSRLYRFIVAPEEQLEELGLSAWASCELASLPAEQQEGDVLPTIVIGVIRVID